MKKTLLLAVVAVSSISAQTLTRGERDRALSALHASRKMFLDSVAGLSDSAWSFKPAPDRWSVAECAEHITLSEDSLFELITKKILLMPPGTPEQKAAAKGKDEAIQKAVADRTNKAQAPEFLRPSGRWPTRDAMFEHFKQSRARVISYVDTTQDELRAHLLNSPVNNAPMDAYQYILLIAAHTERHVAQINEVKADPKFPK